MMIVRSMLILSCFCLQIQVHTRSPPFGRPEERKKIPWGENVQNIAVSSSTTEAQNPDAGKHIIRADNVNTKQEDDTDQRLAQIQTPPARQYQEFQGQDDANGEVVEDVVNLPMDWRQSDSSDEVNAYIVGGEETSITHYPFIVSLQYKNLHRCGGVIINSRTILTAAHCLTGISKILKSWNVVAGRTYHNDSTSGQVVGIQVVEQHPGYATTEKTMTNDLGIVWLNDSLKWDERVQPAKLVENWSYGEDELVTIIGWGFTSPSVASKVLRKVSIGLKGDDFCLRSLKNAEAKTAYGPIMFCTGERRKDSCYADSGGPIVHNEIVVGIVSHSFGDCGASAAWNSKLTAFRSWIKQKLPEEKPEIKVEKSTINSREGYDAELTCIVRAEPKAQFVWMKNNEPLSLDDERIKATKSDSKYLLSIKFVKSSDFGTYSCLAKNIFGETKAEIEVTRKPTADLARIMAASNGIKVQYHVESHEMVNGVKIKYKRVDATNWKKKLLKPCPDVAQATYYGSVMFKNLTSGQTFEFQVSAGNKFGWGRESDVRKFTTGTATFKK